MNNLENLKARCAFERKWLGTSVRPEAVRSCLDAEDLYVEALEAVVADLRGMITELQADLAMRKAVNDTELKLDK